MAKVLKTVAVVAAVVALTAATAGAFAPAGLGTVIGGIGTLGQIAAVAGVVSSVASFGAQLATPLTKASGTDTERIIDDIAEWTAPSRGSLHVERHRLLERVGQACGFRVQGLRRAALAVGGDL